jgi:RecA/RadA recombinase
MSKLLEKLKNSGSIKHASIMDDSVFFKSKEVTSTDLPILNLAFSGELDGGFAPGLSFFSGLSKSFKTMLGLYCLKAYLDKYSDGVCLFYDSEYGTTPDYLNTYGIDTSRVIHIPIIHVEELKFDIVKRLKEINRGDKVFIFIDSIGNLASVKEVEDAENEKSVADMSRAKALKSLWRIITPSLTSKEITCVAINHVYSEIGSMFPKTIMSGGNSGMYAANTVFIISKAQEKDGTELSGYKFTINIEKSRYVKEKAKFPFVVTYKKGIDKYSGLLELALEAGIVLKPKVGWYQKTDPETGEVFEKSYREKDTHTSDFWKDILPSQKFKDFCSHKYKLGDMLESDENNEDEDILETD